MAGLRYSVLTGDALDAALDDVAGLRITVFREWPYLYDGDAEYERGYLESYRASPRAILVGAFDGETLVGAATGTPLADHAAEFAAPLADWGPALDDVFYCAESVLLSAYRGQGAGHRFFDLREAHARALGFRHCVFCAVRRPSDHPCRPQDARDLAPFWRARGYAPLDAREAVFAWRDLGEDGESEKHLQIWARTL